jgi:ATP synthase subunit H.
MSSNPGDNAPYFGRVALVAELSFTYTGLRNVKHNASVSAIFPHIYLLSAMSSALPVVFILVIVLGLMTCAALFTPKGPNQMSVALPSSATFNVLTSAFNPHFDSVIRTAVMITLAACYLMWMVTYLAQLHPLIGEPSLCVLRDRYELNMIQLLVGRQRKHDSLTLDPGMQGFRARCRVRLYQVLNLHPSPGISNLTSPSTVCNFE